jgi:hypothetical protein
MNILFSVIADEVITEFQPMETGVIGVVREINCCHIGHHDGIGFSLQIIYMDDKKSILIFNNYSLNHATTWRSGTL